MNMPGFTAVASLYSNGGRYRAAAQGSGSMPPGEAILSVAGEWGGKIGTGVTWIEVIAKPWATPPWLGGIGEGIAWSTCDAVGKPCCGPDAEVKTQHCHKGLGCNVDSGLCEACGGPGQVCCDGDFTGFSLKGYTGILLDPTERIESCNPGARCDAHFNPASGSWVGTRRCQSCGTKLDGACCAPDNRYALGRCFRDAKTGIRLVCNNPWAGAASACVACGTWNQPKCLTSGESPCDDGLVARESDGICVLCGQPGQPTCDQGEPCRGEWSVPNRWFSECVAAGGPNQPCGKNPQFPCMYGGTFCNSKRICEPCGQPGQPCCPPGRLPGNKSCDPGECRNNRCFACGYENQPVCTSGSPCHCLCEPVNGWCRHCGREGEVCCRPSTAIPICYDGTKCDDGACRRTGGGGGGEGNGWKTCSGQPYTWSTKTWPVTLEDDNGCVVSDSFVANSPDEALQCARTKHGGDKVIATPLEEHTFAVHCPYTGCHERTYPARNHSKAKSCAEFESGDDCSVADGDCPK